jgi:hypothetical protein
MCSNVLYVRLLFWVLLLMLVLLEGAAAWMH